MHALQSIQLVTLLSQPIVGLVPDVELSKRFANSFWGISKCREQRWKLALSKLRPKLAATNRPDESWLEYAQLAEEIFISEMLTRIWLAKVVNASQEEGDLATIAQLIVSEHSQLRLQTLKTLETMIGYDSASSKFKSDIRELQTNVMNSTDMFLAHMDDNPLAKTFAFDPELCVTIARQAEEYPTKSMVKIRQKIGESVYSSLDAVTTGVPYTPDLNSQILDCISGCLSQDLAT